MSISERIDADLKTAMREKDELRRETLRMVVAGFKNRRIELQKDLTDADELAVVQKAVKQRQEAAAEYAKGGRAELAEKEAKEAELLAVYLPRQLSEEETRAVVGELIAELGITEKKQLGQLMKAVMQRHQGQVDGKLVSRLAGELLG